MEQDEQENDHISIPEFTFVMNWFVQYFFLLAFTEAGGTH